MHVGSWTRLLSSSPHNNNTLNGEQLLLLLMLIQPTTNVDKKKIRTQTLFHVGGSLVCNSIALVVEHQFWVYIIRIIFAISFEQNLESFYNGGMQR